MIYYIVAVDKVSHDEYVHSTHNTAEAATEWVERLRKEGSEAIEYRVDAIPEENAVISTSTDDGWKVQSLKMPAFTGTPEPPHIRTEDFTIDELFPQGTHAVAYTLTCSECACEVKNTLNPYLIKHTEWHNKLLP